MFDSVAILVKAGDGGGGAISFRHEKFVPFGGPDGGDGGKGGSVVLRADRADDSLLRYRRERQFRAENGGGGRGQKMHGRNGCDLVLTVPPGTVINKKSGIGEETLLADLAQPGQEVIAARGGKGGWGNVRFASATNQTPQIAQRGEKGEEASLVLEMRLIADVGIIGYPNAGKSTFLAAVSAAKPKIASYPFTTLEPVLGMVTVAERSFVLAEIPGLVPGAHMGKGLGHDFLRHVARTRLLLHLVDGSAEAPFADMVTVNEELSLYDTELSRKPQLVAVNKIDLPEVRARITALQEVFSSGGVGVFFVSAATGEGVPELLSAVVEKLPEIEVAKAPARVFHPLPKVAQRVRKEGEVFVVILPELERLTTRDGRVSGELRHYLKAELDRRGVRKELEKEGVKPGDRIRCGELEWEW